MHAETLEATPSAKQHWDSPFAALGPAFAVAVQPAPLSAPYWVARNTVLGESMGLPRGWTESADWLNALSGNGQLPGMRTSASVYSGHQFGIWAGQLGDGRALLLGEFAGQEVQLKGAGRTPFSRMGDGRAVLRSSIREYLCSEAMHGLDIPTTRALCVTGSDDPVRREEIETAAVVTRVAPSFLRFGHFEHFSHHDQHDDLKQLADYALARYFPQCLNADGNAYAALLAEVTRLTAELMAHWQSVGFCHGVMNTDNMSLLGLTLDYGPFQFLDGYDPAHICNHSDHQGRYAFHKQPNVAYWNLFCLGQALLPLIEDQQMAIAALEPYRDLYPQAFARRMSAKLGFAQTEEAHKPLIEGILKLLAAQRVDFTIFWRRLSHWARDGQDAPVLDLFLEQAGIAQWLKDYGAVLANHDREQAAMLMLSTNPKFVLRNHLAELAIRAAKEKDFQMTADLQKVLSNPFDEHPQHASFADFPPDWASGIEISCSS